MKTILILFLLLTGLDMLAQPVAPSEKAKTFYDKFLKIVDDIRKKDAENTENEKVILKIMADNAMTQIGHIQKRDPAYNVAGLIAMVKPYIDAHTAAVDERNDQLRASVWHTTDQGCSGLFMANTTTEFRTTGGPLGDDERNHKALLDAYDKKLKNILQSHMDGVDHCRKFITDRIETGMKNAIRMQEAMARAEDEIVVRTLYRDITGEEAYWNAALQLYPDLKEISVLQGKLKQMLLANGGLPGLLLQAASRKMERLRNTLMPAAIQLDPALDAEFKEAFMAEGWGETIVKIHLLSRDWSIVRNSLTGAIICRIQTAAIVAKKKDGSCILYDYTIRQAFTGSGYSGTSSRHAHGVLAAEFLCENAK